MSEDAKDVHISLSLNKDQRTVVPLGVPGFEQKTLENAAFTFEYHLSGADPDLLLFEIINEKGTSFFNLKLSASFLKAGTHSIYWDGFDDMEVYDSSRFNNQRFIAKITATKAGEERCFELKFRTRYKEVKWVDVRIDKRSKRIDAVLRTNFKDGGGQGAPGSGKEVKDFNALLKMANDGLRYYWGRNKTHPGAKYLELPEKDLFDIYIHPVQSVTDALKSPAIVCNTNGCNRRSRNWELSRILYYNCGRIKYGKNWYHVEETSASADFKHTAAHEIGHEILLAYGGHIYSKAHKGSSTIITQSALGNFLYPQEGEIDLMVYYTADPEHPYPVDYNHRSVASQQDVLSLLWLTKIEYS